MRRMRHLKPREIQGCQLALDASIPTSLYDATSGGSLVAADGAVARWEDQSGNARHATQGIIGERPLRKVAIQGGCDGVRFDGTDDRMLHTLGSTADPNTIIAAVKWGNASQTSYRGIIAFGVGDSGAMLLMRTGSLFVGSYGAFYKNSTYVPNTAPFTVSQTEVDATLNWRVNGVARGSATDATGSVGQPLLHVGGISGQSLNGDIYQVSVWNVALNESLQNRMQGAAQRKWRIAG